MSDLHRHLTDRITRSRLRLELRRSARPTGTILTGVIIGAACLAYIGSHVAAGSVVKTYEIKVQVATARGVVAGRDDVRFKGVPAGTITKVQLVDGKPILTAKIESSFGPVFRNAHAALRPQTPLQDMYLDVLERGTPGAGLADARDHPLPVSQTSTSVNVAEILQAFSPEVRSHLTAVMGQLGNGLKDRGAALRTAFQVLTPTLQVAQDVSLQLAHQAQSTRRLVHNTRLLTTELGRRDSQLRTLVGDGGKTLRTLADNRGNLEQTIAALPGTVISLQRSLASVASVLPDVNTAVRRLDPVAKALPGGLADLRAISGDAAPAIQALQHPVVQLTPLARTVRPLTATLDRASRALEPQIGAIDHVTRTAAACRIATQRFFQWTPSVFKLGDQRGPAPRADLVFALNASAVLKEPRESPIKSCAGGKAVGDSPGPGGTRQNGGAR